MFYLMSYTYIILVHILSYVYYTPLLLFESPTYKDDGMRGSLYLSFDWRINWEFTYILHVTVDYLGVNT